MISELFQKQHWLIHANQFRTSSSFSSFMTKTVIIHKPVYWCSAKQWTGFYMITASAMKELNEWMNEWMIKISVYKTKICSNLKVNRKRRMEKFGKIHRKTPAKEFLLAKLQGCKFTRGRTQLHMLTCELSDFFQSKYFMELMWTIAPE